MPGDELRDVAGDVEKLGTVERETGVWLGVTNGELVGVGCSDIDILLTKSLAS